MGQAAIDTDAMKAFVREYLARNEYETEGPNARRRAGRIHCVCSRPRKKKLRARKAQIRTR